MPPALRRVGGAGGGTLSALEPGFVPGLVIDGLFGIGLNRPLGADWQALVDTVNRWGAPVLALDVPSGVDGHRRSAGTPDPGALDPVLHCPGAGLELPGSGAGAIGERHLDTLDVVMPSEADDV